MLSALSKPGVSGQETAVEKNVVQSTKFWIEKEAPIWVVEVVPPGGIGIIWGVFAFFKKCYFLATQGLILRKSLPVVRFLLMMFF